MRLLIPLLAACTLASSAVAAGYTPTGTLRVTFAIGETSFDPAVGNDAASDGVIQNVFDKLPD